MNELKYIPKEKIQFLNRVAFKNEKNCLKDNCPIMSGEWNVPIFLALPGIDQTGWVRCMLPASPDARAKVFLDVQSAIFELLPTRVLTKEEQV